MTSFRSTRAQLIGLVAGIALIALCVFALVSTSAQASATTGQAQAQPAWPTGTWVPATWVPPTWWPVWTPRPTHTPCDQCTPPPTRTPWPTRPPLATWTPRPTHTPGSPEPTRTPWPSPTPRPLPPMALVPRLQFGFAQPGSTANYHKILLNTFTQTTTVDLTGTSLGSWTVAVHPTSLSAQPGVSNTIGISVTVPMTPTWPWDLERVRAVSEGTQPFTATSYIVTIARRMPLNDVPEGSWADGPVQYLASRGVISGYPDGTFRPNQFVTRAQFAKILVGAMDWQIISPQTGHFSDVAPGSWAYGYIETAVAHGVISGYPDGTFRPEAYVTRAELAKMVSVARGWLMQPPNSDAFTDAVPGDWFFQYAEMLHSAGVIDGYPDGTFRPNAPATRAQVAKIVTLSLYSEPGR